jgi:hypothetical protein
MIMKESQAECLYEIVKMAERDGEWENDREWKVPDARKLAPQLYPNEDPTTAIRKTNKRIASLGKYVPSLAAKPRTIDPEKLVTEAHSANYLLIFQELRHKGTVTKEQLHANLSKENALRAYSSNVLEEIHRRACDAQYIHTSGPTAPGQLDIGKSLHDQELYLQKLVKSK